MAKIYDIKKDGATVYPRTVSDAVAVAGDTLTDALAKKADKEEVTNTTTLANMAYKTSLNNQTAILGKQDTLESGKNIKTVNGKSLVGEGDVTVFTGITIGEGYGSYVPNENGVVDIPAYIQEIKTPFGDSESLKPSDYTCSVTLPLFVRGMMFNGVPTTPTSMGELVINAVTDVNVNGASVVNDGVANLGTLVKNVTINGTDIPNPTGTIELGSVVTKIKMNGSLIIPNKGIVDLGIIDTSNLIKTEYDTITIGTNAYPNMHLTCDILKIGTTTQWSVIDLDGSIVAQTDSSYFEAGTNASGGEFAMWTARNSNGFIFDMDNSGGIKFGHGNPNNYFPQINITQDKTVIVDNINNGSICLTNGKLELSGDIYATSGEIILGGTSGTAMILKADVQANKLLITCGSKKAEIPLS